MLALRHLTLCVYLLLLAGCASMQPADPTTADWTAHSKQLMALNAWTARGKLAVRTPDASEAASMVWQQDQNNTQLQLSGPLGVGAVTMISDGEQLDIQQGDEHFTLDISTPEAIYTNTGWDIPLQSLTHWLKGVPAPKSKAQQLTFDPETALLQAFTQDDWEVRYEKYQQFQGLALPTRLLVQRGTTRAKVIISQWQFAAD